MESCNQLPILELLSRAVWKGRYSGAASIRESSTNEWERGISPQKIHHAQHVHATRMVVVLLRDEGRWILLVAPFAFKAVNCIEPGERIECFDERSDQIRHDLANLKASLCVTYFPTCCKSFSTSFGAPLSLFPFESMYLRGQFSSEGEDALVEQHGQTYGISHIQSTLTIFPSGER